MSQPLQVVIAETELRAGARVLHGLMFSDHPIVRRTVGEALGELRVEDALRCVAHMEAALLIPIRSRSDLDQTLDAIKQEAMRAVAPEGQRP